jgi:transposase
VDSTQLYQQILGLPAPWQVSEVNINEISGEVVVRVTHTGQGMTCPTCKAAGNLHDHASLRRWRHLDTCQMATVIECTIPRVRCDEHGVLQLPVPWAGPKSRFTLLFESHCIDAMLICPRNGAADLLGASVHSLGRIAHRAVDRGLQRKAESRKNGTLAFPTGLSIDEKSWRGRRYATIIGDPARGVIEDMVPGNGKSLLQQWFERLDQALREAIEYVTMDFHKPFSSAVAATIPDAEDKIVHDKFHLVKAANDAMEQTRRLEMAKCRENKDKDSEKLLKSARYPLLRSGTGLKEKYQDRVDEIDEWFHDTGDAYRMKESVRQILSMTSAEAVSGRLLEWVDWVKGSHLDSMKKVANLVVDRMKGILNIFRLKQSNANAESLNARIQAVRVKSRGHRNYEAFRNDMLFHLGGLELHPVFPA